MTKENKSVVKTILILAIAVSALFLLVRDLSYVDSAINDAAKTASKKYQRDASSVITEHCSNLSSLAQSNCVERAYEFAREGQRKEQDLAAQKVTAWWTKIMGVAALIGMALSAVGVWLVKTTFEETRRSADAAVRAVEAAITVNAFDVFINSNAPFNARLPLENIGGSVAHDLEVVAEFDVFNGDEMVSNFNYTTYPIDLQRGEKEVAEIPIKFPNHDEILRACDEQNLLVKAKITCKYSSVFGVSKPNIFYFMCKSASRLDSTMDHIQGYMYRVGQQQFKNNKF